MDQHAIVYRNPVDLAPYEKNSRTHSAEQIENLRASIREFGFNNPILLKDDERTIGAGHARCEAALAEGLDSVPTITLHNLSDTQWRAYVIADNQLAISGAGWDEDILRREIEALAGLEFDMPVLGFDERELARLLAEPQEGGQAGGRSGGLAEEFLIPPFSVLNAREGWWQDRKRQWIALGIESEVGRGEAFDEAAWVGDKPKAGAKSYATPASGLALGTAEWTRRKIEEGELSGGMSANQSGTSIFDPVLCELVYRWFAPMGGRVLDPFAGGSVRGITAAALGRAYVGIDLRPEQVEANRVQWPAVRDRLAVSMASGPEVPPLRTEDHEGIRVVRDDAVLGGTNRRALDRILPGIEAPELVYATPAFGFAQIALAYAARALGRRATIFVAARKTRHPRTQLAAAAGAQIIEVEAGRLNVIQSRARAYCAEHGAELLPFGLEGEDFVEAIADIARELPGDPPSEVWCVAGSGVLTRALQRAWPDAAHHAVQIGRAPEVGAARLWQAPEKFEDDAQDPPPFPSCSNYDAKAWRFIREHAQPGALFWNLGADPEPALERGELIEPRWHEGDSSVLLGGELDEYDKLGWDYDLIFSCPPYGDLEVYSDDPADISTLPMGEFDEAYADIIAKAVRRLADDRFACFVVGDYRDKHGLYANFVSKTIACFEAAGARLYNEIVLLTAVGSLPIRMAKQFRSTRKCGKALRNGTGVLTPTGWVAIERLSSGDLVMAGDGTPTRVTGVFPQGVRPMLKITFNDGVQIDADPDHLWQVSIAGRETVMNTAEILCRWGEAPADPRPAIPSCKPVQFPTRPVPLHPYLVGLLLGDGGLTGNTPILSTADLETVQLLPAILPAHMTIKARGYDLRLVGVGARSLRNPLTIELRRLGMMGRLSGEKAVPAVYLWNSVEVRLAVLRGLMDTDGCISGRRGSTEFSSASAQLADDVVFLARSLGAKVTRSVKATTHQPAHRVRISGGLCPFQLKRKADRWHTANDKRIKRMNRRITAIRPASPGPATCIAVEHPSRLFIAENFVVTHNTHQNVLVFVKGDPRKATEACGPVDVTAALAEIEPADEE